MSFQGKGRKLGAPPSPEKLIEETTLLLALEGWTQRKSRPLRKDDFDKLLKPYIPNCSTEKRLAMRYALGRLIRQGKVLKVKKRDGKEYSLVQAMVGSSTDATNDVRGLLSAPPNSNRSRAALGIKRDYVASSDTPSTVKRSPLPSRSREGRDASVERDQPQQSHDIPSHAAAATSSPSRAGPYPWFSDGTTGHAPFGSYDSVYGSAPASVKKNEGVVKKTGEVVVLDDDEDEVVMLDGTPEHLKKSWKVEGGGVKAEEGVKGEEGVEGKWKRE